MCMGSPKIPDPQPVQQAPQLQDEAVTGSRDEATRRARARAGAASTNITTSTSASAPTAGKTLLGQ